MKKLDIFVKVLFALVLFLSSFFWECKYDIIVTVLVGIVLILFSVVSYKQHRKLKEVTSEE